MHTNISHALYKRHIRCGCAFCIKWLRKNLFLLPKFGDLVVGQYFFLESVRAGFVALDHLNALRKVLTRTCCFECCNYFLCHVGVLLKKLLDFTMNGHLLQIRIVFAAFEPFGCVLLVLGGDVAGHPRDAAFTLFGTFQNDLNPYFFLCHTWSD